MSDSEVNLVISTYSGLEDVLAKEIRQLGGRDIETHTRAVSCTGDMGFVYKANFSLRTALRVMMKIHSFKIVKTDDLYEGAKEVDWTRYMKLEQTFAVRCTTSSSMFDNNLFPALRVKDAIADAFRTKGGKRPDVSKENPDLEVNVFITRNNDVTLLLNTSGLPLYQRGYRKEVDRAPLSEALAAGIVILSGWEPHKPLVDFMCGSGTIPIEAALYAAQIPPGVFREKFAFENWIDFNQELYNTIRDGQVAKIKDVEAKIYGNELNKFVAEKARANVKAAGVEDMVTITTGDFKDFDRPEGNGVVIINPPYGEKIDVRDIKLMYQDIGDNLKQQYSGYDAWIFTGSPEGAKAVGLRPHRRFHLFNGPIECRMFGYNLYDGSKKDLYKNSEETNSAETE